MHEVKHSIREARISAGVAEAWKPEGRPAAVLLRWFATHGCNLRCPYCRQNHARRQPIDGHRLHCFDNRPVDHGCGRSKAFSLAVLRRVFSTGILRHQRNYELERSALSTISDQPSTGTFGKSNHPLVAEPRFCIVAESTCLFRACVKRCETVSQGAIHSVLICAALAPHGPDAIIR